MDHAELVRRASGGEVKAFVELTRRSSTLRSARHWPLPATFRRGGDPGGAVDTDSNASRAGEVERKLWLDNIFFCSAAS